MYSKRPNIKGSSRLADVNVGTDKGSLRLQFSTRVSQEFYGKRQAYKGLGRSDTPENKQWADGIARRIQADIDHPDGGLFDPTLAKYLDIKPMLATVTQLPTARALPTLGELWSKYIAWKLQTQQIAESTHRTLYQTTYTTLLTPFLEQEFGEETASLIINTLNAKKTGKHLIKTLYGALSSLSLWAINNNLGINRDYFNEIKESYRLPKKSQQLQEEEDYKAYTLEERDIIINAFYESNKKHEREVANLIEFLFLTGCRHGEAFALRWKDIKFDSGWIIFGESYSYSLKKTKTTKTEVIRWFKMKGMNRLINLLKTLKEKTENDDELVFSNKGKYYDSPKIRVAWNHNNRVNEDGKAYSYPGVVSRLATQGLIHGYLKPYSTRHTFISIQANNGADLGLLADSCGNSVDTLIKHYLQPDKERVLKDI
ncbi:tyrosine-type recombinase/integrase [Nostoc sp. NMS4]|uniref:tyrosine-type recombinase/integrase n=1 Tax=Nostoc sp. NMS4 TaxID=2815390 RepID=UPI0025D4CA1C|nr:tyrosine-type recombinase/integrase [Nostoc sp. NMS4]MBN3927439.1 tyrosine-type recombinase/integrase [Nostoc sp. NMS4]